MTRKDYVAIAEAFRRAIYSATYTGNSPVSMDAVGPDGVANWKRASQNVTLSLARDIADKMQRDNPRFDRARFLKACGVQS